MQYFLSADTRPRTNTRSEPADRQVGPNKPDVEVHGCEEHLWSAVVVVEGGESNGYTLPRRGGRVVECGGLENRYVGNPGVGGSNPPLSAFQHAGYASWSARCALAGSASQHAQASAFACQQRFGLRPRLQPFVFRPRSAAREKPLLAEVGFYARSGALGRLAESRRPEGGGVLTSEARRA